MLKVHEAWYILDKRGALEGSGPDAFSTIFTKEFEDCAYSLCVGDHDEGKAFIAFTIMVKNGWTESRGLIDSKALIDNPLKHGHLLRDDGRIEKHSRA